MSEDVKEPAVSVPAPKQYLLVVDEMGMAFLNKVMPSIVFVEVKGMYLQGDDNNQFLINPTPKAVVAPVPEAAEAA